jgi:hypothetical protein
LAFRRKKKMRKIKCLVVGLSVVMFVGGGIVHAEADERVGF